MDNEAHLSKITPKEEPNKSQKTHTETEGQLKKGVKWSDVIHELSKLSPENSEELFEELGIKFDEKSYTFVIAEENINKIEKVLKDKFFKKT